MALKVLYCQLAVTTTSSLPHKDDMEEDEAAAHAESNSQADTGDVRMTEPSAVPLKEKLKAKLLTKSVPINKKKSPTIPLPALKDFHFLILEEMATVYRSLAVAYALQDSRDVTESINASQKLGATLRAQASSHISKHEHFKRPTRGGPKNLRMDRFRSPMNNGLVPRRGPTDGSMVRV